MSVDVLTDVVIDRPVDLVSAYATDPSNAPTWYANIDTVEWKTEPPARVGSAVAFSPGSSAGGSSTRTSSSNWSLPSDS